MKGVLSVVQRRVFSSGNMVFSSRVLVRTQLLNDKTSLLRLELSARASGLTVHQ